MWSLQNDSQFQTIFRRETEFLSGQTTKKPCRYCGETSFSVSWITAPYDCHSEGQSNRKASGIQNAITLKQGNGWTVWIDWENSNFTSRNEHTTDNLHLEVIERQETSLRTEQAQRNQTFLSIKWDKIWHKDTHRSDAMTGPRLKKSNRQRRCSSIDWASKS